MYFKTIQYNGLNTAQQLAYYAFQHQLQAQDKITIQDIDNITQNDKGKYVVTLKNDTQPIICVAALKVDGQLVLLDDRYRIISDVNYMRELQQLINASETALVFSAYIKSKELLMDNLYRLPSRDSTLNKNIEKRAANNNPYTLGSICKHAIVEPGTISNMYLRKIYTRVFENSTQIVVGDGSASLRYKHKRVLHGPKKHEPTQMDQMRNRIKISLGRKASREAINQEFQR